MFSPSPTGAARSASISPHSRSLCGGEAASSRPVRPRRMRSSRRTSSPVHVQPEAGGQGFVTGFYEPEVEASPVRTERFTVPLLSRPADLVDIDDAQPARRVSTRISPSAARTGDWHRRIFRPPGHRTGRACRQGAGDRLARGQGRCLLHPCAGRGAAEDDRRHAAPRHLCGQERPALHRPRQHSGRARRDPAGRGDDAVDPPLVPRPSRPHRRDPLAKPLLHLLPRCARRRSGARADRRREGAADAGPLDRRRPAAAHIRHAVLHRRAVADRIRGQVRSAG